MAHLEKPEEIVVDKEETKGDESELDLDEEQIKEIEELLSLNKTPQRMSEMLQIDLEIIEEYIRRKQQQEDKEK